MKNRFCKQQERENRCSYTQNFAEKSQMYSHTCDFGRILFYNRLKRFLEGTRLPKEVSGETFFLKKGFPKKHYFFSTSCASPSAVDARTVMVRS